MALTAPGVVGRAWTPPLARGDSGRGIERTAGASVGILLRHEVREMLAGRALWAALLLVSPLVGYGFIRAVELFAFASRGAQQSAELAHTLSPLDGVIVPTFGALYLANTFLLPFVAIRALGHDKQNGTLKLLMQLPVGPGLIVGVKALALGLGWLLLAFSGLSAMAIWLGLGGHISWPEMATVLLGHALYGYVIIGLAFACAALTESTATAALAVLAVTLGCWVLDFAAQTQTGWVHDLGALSLTATLKPFEHGLIATPSAILMLALGTGLLALAVVCISADVSPRVRLLRAAGVVGAVVVVGMLGFSFPGYVDVTEDRRNSFTPADEQAFRAMTGELVVTAHLAPNDSRLRDFDREILSTLRRVVPHLRIENPSQPRAGVTGAPRDDRYGIVGYDYNGAHAESRSTSTDDVLPLIHALAGQHVVPETTVPYPGYPLIADAGNTAVWFFAGLPAALVLGWWFSRGIPRRRGAFALAITLRDPAALAARSAEVETQ
jgi:ABC-type transport system involved in multi-copper enzyme maturation permease subunit